MTITTKERVDPITKPIPPPNTRPKLVKAGLLEKFPVPPPSTKLRIIPNKMRTSQYRNRNTTAKRISGKSEIAVINV
ncbi:hypothetical protein D3C77_575960 [compost metagenome]